MSDDPIDLDAKRKKKDAEVEKKVEGSLEFLEEAAKYQEQLRVKRDADRKKKNDEIIKTQKLRKR